MNPRRSPFLFHRSTLILVVLASMLSLTAACETSAEKEEFRRLPVSEYAGETTWLVLTNASNGGDNEAARWARIEIVTE